MKITICGSMVFAEVMAKTKEELEKRGHIGLVSEFLPYYRGNEMKQIEKLAHQDKVEQDYIRKFCKYIEQSEAILVLNHDKRGIKNYIVGNTLIQIRYVHILN